MGLSPTGYPQIFFNRAPDCPHTSGGNKVIPVSETADMGSAPNSHGNVYQPRAPLATKRRLVVRA